LVWFMLAVGLTILTLGAELLVRGASRLAIALRISPLVVGLTIVAFGTSAPELIVSLESGLNGEPDVALGNVLGSNILNVLLILGLSAVVVPLIVSQQLVRLDVPLLVVVSLVVGGMAIDGAIGRFDGLVLVTGLIVWNVWVIRKSRSESKEIEEEYAREFGGKVPLVEGRVRQTVLNAALLGLGLGLLVFGASVFVENAVSIARSLHVSELVIGLTLVAGGTSLPEVATSVVAAIRGERDIAVGSVVGSNLYNLLCVLGVTSLVVGEIPVARDVLMMDIPIMIAVAIACMPVFLTGHRIERWEGGVFLFFYLVFTTDVVLHATDSPLSAPLRSIVIWIAIPATVFAFTWSQLRWRRIRRVAADRGSADAPE
jgi:cation:H+ antiporter